MNGDLKTIYDAIIKIDKKIVEIQTIQKLRHEENKKHIVKLDNLPCERHFERIAGLDKTINWLFTLVVVVIIGGVVLGYWLK